MLTAPSCEISSCISLVTLAGTGRVTEEGWSMRSLRLRRCTEDMLEAGRDALKGLLREVTGVGVCVVDRDLEKGWWEGFEEWVEVAWSSSLRE